MPAVRRKPGRPPKSETASAPHMSRQIAAVAVDLFFDKGYNATTIRDIADACGITPGALYNHFPAKERLLLSIIDEADRALERDMDTAIINAGSAPRDQLTALVRSFVLYCARHSKVAQVSAQEYKFLPESEREAVKTFRRRLRSMFEAVIQRGVNQREFVVPMIGDQPSARLAAVAIGDMCTRVAEWFAANKDVSAEMIAGHYAEMALRLVTDAGTAQAH